METIPTNLELNWEFVEPLNEKALSGLEDQLKMGLSDAFKDFVKRSNYGFSQGDLLWWAISLTHSNMF
ncbi:hypothetical protein VN0211_11370 [Helicobacter pylori]|nr:hypothetical protein VN0211_11370 [Helicobacter pylori]